MIGCGSMGGGMALLFAENGVNVSLSDPAEATMDSVIDKAEKAGYNDKLKKYTGRSFLLFLFSPTSILTGHQTTNLSAAHSHNHGFWSSPCPMEMSATKYSKA
jgi:H2-forming N5,N10-methylenetetrahydromethanopterin dehydrogenase-like enzyme